MFAGDAVFPGEVHWGTKCLMFAGDAVFPGEVHWGTRGPMFAGDAVFPSEVHWDTRGPMFAGDAVFPGEVHWGTRCLMFAGDAVFPSDVHWDTRCPIFAGDAVFRIGAPIHINFGCDQHSLLLTVSGITIISASLYKVHSWWDSLHVICNRHRRKHLFLTSWWLCSECLKLNPCLA